MKHFKKFFSYLVALTMVLSLAAFTGVKVHATEGTTDNSLTITNNGQTAHTFELYQIFTGTKQSGSNILGDVAWGDSVTTDGQTHFGNPIEKAKNLNNNAANAEAFAKELVDGDKVNKKDYLGDAYRKSTSVPAGKSYTFGKDNSLPTGYYLVKDVDGTQTGNESAYTEYICAVDGATDLHTKLDVPTTIKKVKENHKPVNEKNDETDTNMPGVKLGDHFNDVADYDIGDDIPYELIGSLPTNYAKYTNGYYYQFTDIMDKGLTRNDDVEVWYLSDGKKWSKIKSGFNASATSKYGETDKTTFTVTFDNLKNVKGEDGNTIALDSNSKIKVTFTAKLNADAVCGLPGNVNESYLKYSNNVNDVNGKGETPHDKVVVFTYEIETTKIDEATKNSSNPTALKDAQFQIKKGDNYLHQDDNGYITWGTADGAKTFTSGDDGKFVIKGLDSGTYTFHETKAPAGYNLPDNDLTVELTATTSNGQSWNGTPEKALTKLTLKENSQAQEQEQDHEKHGTASQTITNDKGSLLPSTGGMGTTLLYVAGGILVACAAAYVVMSRKHSTNK